MLNRLNDFLSIILKCLAIFVIALAGVYIIICVWGNIAIAKANQLEEASYPSVKNAPYQFTIRVTGQRLFARRYESSKDGSYDVYDLKYGHYEDRKGKWVWDKKPLPFLLNERLWGEIEVVKR